MSSVAMTLCSWIGFRVNSLLLFLPQGSFKNICLMLFSAAVSHSWLLCPGHSPSAPVASVPISKGLPQLARELHPSIPASPIHLLYLIFSPQHVSLSNTFCMWLTWLFFIAIFSWIMRFVSWQCLSALYPWQLDRQCFAHKIRYLMIVFWINNERKSRAIQGKYQESPVGEPTLQCLISSYLSSPYSLGFVNPLATVLSRVADDWENLWWKRCGHS